MALTAALRAKKATCDGSCHGIIEKSDASVADMNVRIHPKAIITSPHPCQQPTIETGHMTLAGSQVSCFFMAFMVQ